MTNCENFKIVSNNPKSPGESESGSPPVSNRRSSRSNSGRNNDKDQYFGLDAFFNENATFFKDVYIYGKLYYEFESNTIEIFNEVEIKGDATFLSDVNLVGNINAGIITARKKLDVGCEGTTLNADVDTGKVGIKTSDPITTLDINGDAHISDKLGIGITNPTQTFDVIGGAYVSENIGIGSNIPQQRIDVAGSIKIDENIYDSVNSPGKNGYYFVRDIRGVRWLEEINSNDGMIPLSIVLWGGNGNFPPPGYELCDGTNGKPNLAPITDLNGNTFQYVIKVY